MISTRQLIFILNIVFFFVNPAISGNSSSTGITRCFQFLFGEQASTSNVAESSSSINNKPVYDYKQIINDEKDKILYEVTSEHIEYCKMELFNAFKQGTGWNNFLYAFSNISNADFDKEWSIYSKATAEYFFDLLCVAHEMGFQPRFMNPRAFCREHYGHKENDCLRSIKKMGCEADVPGIVCLRYLYLNWKDEELPDLTPVRGTENVSNENLKNAFSRITFMFPNLSKKDLFERLSNKNLLNDFYLQNKNRHQITKMLRNEFKYKEYEQLRKGEISEETLFDSDEDEYINIDNFEEFRWKYRCRSSEAARRYANQRNKDIKDACESCYGIGVPYIKMIVERKRRQNLYRVHVNRYAAILLNQLQECGQMNQDFIEKHFKDREQFCTSFLSENRHYYDFMYLFTE